jgi:hypothetical protein
MSKQLKAFALRAWGHCKRWPPVRRTKQTYLYYGTTSRTGKPIAARLNASLLARLQTMKGGQDHA